MSKANIKYVSIITIGDELLIGQTIDTNSVFIAKELNKEGLLLRRCIKVGDVKEDIIHAIDEESKYADVIIMTGGLGPTADDITKPLLCEYFGGKMIMNEDVLKHITYLFEVKMKRPMIERNRKQAEVPDVCTVLFNELGTAPGMLFEKKDKLYFSLPGVPFEMKNLFTTAVMPAIKDKFETNAVLHRTLMLMGIGESFLAEILTGFENKLPENIKLAYLPHLQTIRLRLTATGINETELNKELDKLFAELLILVNEYLVTDKDETIAEVVGKLLKEKGKSLSTAESCTGGYIAHLLTKHPGASTCYFGSVVSYSNDVKQNVLHVKPETLQQHGAVSEETVKQMALGAIAELKTDFSVAVSGIMGPDGGTEEKPVGLVWVAAAHQSGKVETMSFNFRFYRELNIELTALNALNFLRKFIFKNT